MRKVFTLPSKSAQFHRHRFAGNWMSKEAGHLSYETHQG